jgi:hypothetical protein
MAKYIPINRGNGYITIVRSALETTSEDPLTEHELIINELYQQIQKLYTEDNIRTAMEYGMNIGIDSIAYTDKQFNDLLDLCKK